MYKSTDGGAGCMNIGLRGLTVSALALDPHTPTTLYAGTSGGVFILQQAPRP